MRAGAAVEDEEEAEGEDEDEDEDEDDAGVEDAILAHCGKDKAKDKATAMKKFARMDKCCESFTVKRAKDAEFRQGRPSIARG